jgi:hypothetical protein
MVTVDPLFEPVYDPAPLPAHEANVYPGFGVALIGTSCPPLYQLLGGATVPVVVSVVIVKKYCGAKVAVNAESLVAVIE